MPMTISYPAAAWSMPSTKRTMRAQSSQRSLELSPPSPRRGSSAWSRAHEVHHLLSGTNGDIHEATMMRHDTSRRPPGRRTRGGCVAPADLTADEETYLTPARRAYDAILNGALPPYATNSSSRPWPTL